MSILERLIALIAPDTCIACAAEGSVLCHACEWRLNPAPGCIRCGLPGGSVRGSCLAGLHASDLRAVAAYEDVAKQLVATVKFGGSRAAARRIATLIAPYVAKYDHCVLVPIPATVSHVRQRGFDQSVLITRHVSKLSGIPWLHALARSGSKHQLGANREQRTRQLQTAIRVTSMVSGRNIVLIDDVLTTGSSMDVAAKALRAAGAAQVCGVAFAQAATIYKKPPKM